MKLLHSTTDATRGHGRVNSANFCARNPPRAEPNICTCGKINKVANLFYLLMVNLGSDQSVLQIEYFLPSLDVNDQEGFETLCTIHRWTNKEVIQPEIDISISVNVENPTREVRQCFTLYPTQNDDIVLT